jgi:hypothetical protein
MLEPADTGCPSRHGVPLSLLPAPSSLTAEPLPVNGRDIHDQWNFANHWAFPTKGG